MQSEIYETRTCYQCVTIVCPLHCSFAAFKSLLPNNCLGLVAELNNNCGSVVSFFNPITDAKIAPALVEEIVMFGQNVPDFLHVTKDEEEEIAVNDDEYDDSWPADECYD